MGTGASGCGWSGRGGYRHESHLSRKKGRQEAGKPGAGCIGLRGKPQDRGKIMLGKGPGS